MLTTRMASTLSRQTMKRALPMAGLLGLFDDDLALGRVLVELAEEGIGAGLPRREDGAAGHTRGHHQFLHGVAGLELFRAGIAVGHLDAEARSEEHTSELQSPL